MGKLKSQILMLMLLAALLIVTPLLSSSLRPKYLYFIINLLIIALGAEAGLLSTAFSKPLDDNKKNYVVSSSTKSTASSTPPDPSSCTQKKPVRVVEKSASEKKIVGEMKVDKVHKCPSMPSLFFIGNGSEMEEDSYQNEPVAKEEEGGGGSELSGQELFTKAETFIGNFYKQLKMQREESRNKIHGFFN